MNEDFLTITCNYQQHSLHQSHNEILYEQAKYLWSLFDDNCVNADELIIDFASNNRDFLLHCYIGNVFETTADAFMLSVIFNKSNVIQSLLQTNKDKLNKHYAHGLGLSCTPRQLLFKK